MQDRIPERIFEAIQQHLQQTSFHGEQGWEAGDEEEDTLTGDFCSSLRRRWTRPVQITSSKWRWRISYKKFRSSSQGAEEKHLGADGIVQVEIEDVANGNLEAKGMLFQAKKHRSYGNARLLDQCRKMESLVRNSAAVFIYGPKQYNCMKASQVIRTKGSVSKVGDQKLERIGAFLAGRFLPCDTGVRGLFYDANRHTLVFPTETAGVKRLRFMLKHRLRIEVQKVDE